MTYVSHAPSDRKDFLGDLNDAVRENPISAALIGAGLAWMLFGGSRNSLLAGAGRGALTGLSYGAQQAGSAAYRGAQAVGSGAHAVGSGVSAAVGSVGSAAGALVSHASDTLRSATEMVGAAAEQVSGQAGAAYEAAGQMARTSTDMATRASGDMMSRAAANLPELSMPGHFPGEDAYGALKELFAKQPLLLGALGIAVGAGLAASMPSTELEKNLVGGAADGVKEKAQDLVSQAQSMASKGLEAAKTHGLGADGLSGALRDVSQKVASVADKALQDTAGRLKE